MPKGFQKGNPGKPKGAENLKTRIFKAYQRKYPEIKEITDLKERLIDIATEMLEDPDATKTEKAFAFDKVGKYVFTTKQENTVTGLEDYLKTLKDTNDT